MSTMFFANQVNQHNVVSGHSADYRFWQESHGKLRKNRNKLENRQHGEMTETGEETKVLMMMTHGEQPQD